MSVKKIGFLHSGSFYHEADLKDPVLRSYDVEDLYIPDTQPADIMECDSLVVAGRVHQGTFTRLIPAVLEFINTSGKKIYIEGENNVGAWLEGTREEPRPTNFWAWRTGEDTTRRNRNTDHPMWKYYTDEALHWHFHGALYPPQGAVPLVVLEEWAEEDGAIIYYDNATFPAELVVTSMDPCYHHGAGFMPGATQLLYRSLRWLAD